MVLTNVSGMSFHSLISEQLHFDTISRCPSMFDGIGHLLRSPWPHKSAVLAMTGSRARRGSLFSDTAVHKSVLYTWQSLYDGFGTGM